MRAPYSTDGMYSLGIEPPNTLFSNAMPSSQPSFLSTSASSGLPSGSVPLNGSMRDRAVAELTATTRLLHVLAARFGLLGDRFLVGDLRLADDHFHLVVARQLVAQNFQVQLAHAGDDGLAGFFVVVGAEGRILALAAWSAPRQASACRRPVLGSIDMLMTGSGNVMPFQHDRMIRIAQRVAGVGFLDADDRR